MWQQMYSRTRETLIQFNTIPVDVCLELRVQHSLERGHHVGLDDLLVARRMPTWRR